MSRILIVEDEMKLRDHLSNTLSSEGYLVSTCSTYAELEDITRVPAQSFDLIVLDRLLQGRDAGEMVPVLRKDFADARIMILSAINTPTEKAHLLDLGADDYLAKPFEAQELIARVRVLFRRGSPDLHFGNLKLSIEDRSVSIDGREMPLTNKEFLFLKTLVQAPGRIFSKNFLYEKVWDVSSDVESNVIESTVTKIRRRLEDLGSSVQIKNSRNVGYWVEE